MRNSFVCNDSMQNQVSRMSIENHNEDQNEERNLENSQDSTLPSEKPSTLRIWLMEMRLPFATASTVPVLLGTAIAWAKTGIFLFDVFLLTLVAGVCLHFGANISNDYFDHISGNDDINVDFVSPFTGGSRMIQLGLLTPRAVLAGSMVFFAIGGIIGIYLTLTRGIWVLVLGVIGAGSAFFYTAPPFKFVHRGIGEVFIGLNFGILMTLGAYYVQTLTLELEPVVASIPIAILISAVLYINEFPDYTADKAVGKRTMVVLLGKERAALGYAGMMTSVYLSIAIAFILSIITWYPLIALSTLPLSILGVRRALKAYDRIFEMIPANVSTVVGHLLTGIVMTVGYILEGLASPLEYVIATGLFFFAISLFMYRKLSLPPS
jgi:1,4-dihydroxy-2-naphthoate octaprenyltransferase